MKPVIIAVALAIGLGWANTPALGQLDDAAALNARVEELHRAGRFSEAVPLAQQALGIREKTLGSDHPDVATSLSTLAELYLALGRRADAAPLYQRALAIYKKSSVNDKALSRLNTQIAQLTELLAIEKSGKAGIEEQLARLRSSLATAEAERDRYKRILESGGGGAASAPGKTTELAAQLDAEKRLSSRALAQVEVLNQQISALRRQLAALEQMIEITEHKDKESQARIADLGQRLNIALAQRVQELTRFRSDYLDVATWLDGLAERYTAQGRYADAEPLFQQVLAIREKGLYPDHPDVSTSLNKLAGLYLARGRHADALPLVSRAIAHGRANPSIALPVLFSAQGTALMSADKAQDDALNAVQRGAKSAVAVAVNKFAVRLAAGSDRLAQLVRRDQDFLAETETLDTRLQQQIPVTANQNLDQIKERLAAIAKERDALQKVLAREFPNYAALSNPQPLTAKEIQALLSDDEALLQYVVGDREESYLFAVTRQGTAWKRIALGGTALSEKVAAFRRGLDVEAVTKPAADGKPALFDLGLSNELYATLLGSVEPLVKDKKQLLIVPSGALTALPFHLLVTAKPSGAAPSPDNLAPYRNAAWLSKRQAVTVLPSITTLSLRTLARKDVAANPMVGFGDPVFNPNIAVARASPAAVATVARPLVTRSFADFWQGAGVDRAMLSKALPPLPDTAVELRAVAQKLGVPASHIHLGPDASETKVKRLPLTDYRIVYFATHGLVAGDIKGLAEPSLALSIPAQPSDFDDGLLTASEVAQLKLNADWVVLSACNTIAGDKPGAEALSGLARAFFYAGARALLVSHWAVDSNAATRLTTATFDLLKSDPKLGRAEALRRAMLAYMNDTSNPRNAYPAYWAPFVVVGEGTAR